MGRRRWRGAAVLFLVLTGCGAEPDPELSVTVVKPGETRSIATNTQATFGDLRIGVGNVWEDRYTDARGRRRDGLTAGMWLFFRVDASHDQHVRVHPGQRVAAGGYAIEVLDVEEAVVRVRVTRPRRT